MFRRKSTPGEVVAIADIDSDSVGISVARIEIGKAAVVLVSERRSLSIEERSGAHTDSAIVALLDMLCKNAADTYALKSRDGSARPVSKTYIVLGTPWVKTATVRAATEFPDERRITDDLIRRLARHAFLGERELRRTNVFEACIVSIELNGYPTLSPDGKHAHGVFISALISECDPTFRGGVADALRRHFPSSEPLVRSEARSLLSITRESGTRTQNHTLISVSGDTSSVIIMRKGVLGEHVNIAEGTANMLRRIGGATLPEDTMSLLRMVMKDACSTPACEQINSAIATAEPDMVKVFGQSLAMIASRHRLPNALTLVVRPEFASWLQRFFSRIDFAQFTITTQPFETQVLTTQHLNAFATPESGVSLDAGSAVAVGFVNIELLRE